MVNTAHIFNVPPRIDKKKCAIYTGHLDSRQVLRLHFIPSLRDDTCKTTTIATSHNLVLVLRDSMTRNFMMDIIIIIVTMQIMYICHLGPAVVQKSTSLKLTPLLI